MAMCFGEDKKKKKIMSIENLKWISETPPHYQPRNCFFHPLRSIILLYRLKHIAMNNNSHLPTNQSTISSSNPPTHKFIHNIPHKSIENRSNKKSVIIIKSMLYSGGSCNLSVHSSRDFVLKCVSKTTQTHITHMNCVRSRPAFHPSPHFVFLCKPSLVRASSVIAF